MSDKEIGAPKKAARFYLTKQDLALPTGSELLELCLRITEDGKLDLEEIKELRRWLKNSVQQTGIVAIPYLHDIMTRITADGVIDRDELTELHLAVERVIPASYRKPAEQARKKLSQARRERKKQQREAEKSAIREKREQQSRELREANRIRHNFAKVVGVTFPNDDGSERQRIIANCSVGEWLIFQRDIGNRYSDLAIYATRTNGEILGHCPEYVCEMIQDRADAGYKSFGLVVQVTGGTVDRATRGVNFAIISHEADVTDVELVAYAQKILAER